MFITRIGDCLELDHGTVRRGARVESGISLVDGLGIGDIGDVVLRDRKQLSADGTIVIVCRLHDEDGHPAEPEVITRGFAFAGAESAETLLDEVYECAADAIDALPEREIKLLQTTSTTPSRSSPTRGRGNDRS